MLSLVKKALLFTDGAECDVGSFVAIDLLWVFKHLKYDRKQTIETVINFLLHHDLAQLLTHGQKTVISFIGEIVNLLNLDVARMWHIYNNTI